MDHSESGRAHLTDEQRQQRCAWAKEMWASVPSSEEWLEVTQCIDSLVDQGLIDVATSIDMFIEPETHLQALDLLFEEYLSRKLIGDFT